MDILVTCDKNYLPQLKTMLYTLFVNNPSGNITIHFIYKKMNEKDIKSLESFIHYCSKGRAKLASYEMKQHAETFENGVVNMYYTEEMYYYLLAYNILPKEVKRVIYLDPDILILNSLDEIYNMNMKGNMFAGSQHDFHLNVDIQNLRFKAFTDISHIDYYINTGALVMDLEEQRKNLNPKELSQYISQAHPAVMILPDQDVFNYLYAEDITLIPEEIFNYDARYYKRYLLKDRSWDMHRIIEETVVLHFCGAKKPWKKFATGEFVSLYLYFQNKAQIISQNLEESYS